MEREAEVSFADWHAVAACANAGLQEDRLRSEEALRAYAH